MGRNKKMETSYLDQLRNSQWFGFAVASSYGVVSIAITFFNKAVFSLYGFGASNFLTLSQAILSIVFLQALKRAKLIEFNDFSVETARRIGMLGVSFTTMALTGLAALKYVNVPMYSALRRLTTFIVIVVQFVMLGRTVSTEELLSVVAMVLGAMIASFGDLTFDLWGYMLVFANCGTTAWYLVLIAKKQRETGLNSFGLMFYNNIFSIPIITVLVYFTEFNDLVVFEQWMNPGFQIVFVGSCLLAFALNYFVFLCSIVNSPLATSITGQLKSIVSTLLGLVLFGGVIMTTNLGVGLSVSTFGGLWYGKVKYVEQISRAPATPPPVTTERDNSDVDLEQGDGKEKL